MKRDGIGCGEGKSTKVLAGLVVVWWFCDRGGREELATNKEKGQQPTCPAQLRQRKARIKLQQTSTAAHLKVGALARFGV